MDKGIYSNSGQSGTTDFVHGPGGALGMSWMYNFVFLMYTQTNTFPINLPVQYAVRSLIDYNCVLLRPFKGSRLRGIHPYVTRRYTYTC